MCGIIGEFASDPIDSDLFEQMRDVLVHRGPDGAGMYLNDDGTVALGSRRLSIIDTSEAGDMPIANETDDVWVVYNGEIYNFESIRDELVERGHEFESGTDTEVLVHGYEEWGEGIVERVRGMFAFLIYDKEEDLLFGARDRLGIKPFYYYNTGSRFIAASELKAIIEDNTIPRRVDPVSVKHFLMYRYVPGPRSIWEGISKLPPGHTLTYDGETLKVDEYWNLEDSIEHHREATDDPVGRIEELLEDSVREHLVSDVPISVLLSGGLDSSLVTAFSSKHLETTSTYSLGFDAEQSELPDARRVAEAFETNHSECILDATDLSTLVGDLMYYYDEPLGDSSMFPTFLIMQAISEDYKVALSGDGGDESFAGYNWYTRHRLVKKLDPLSPVFNVINSALGAVPLGLNNVFIDALKYRIEAFSLSGVDRYRHLMAPRFDADAVDALLTDDLMKASTEADDVMEQHARHGLESVRDLQKFDVKTFLLDDILTKVDRASMANSLEVRVPLLDHRIVSTALSFDEETLFDDGDKKHLLKKVARRVLPEETLEKKKQGFSAPLDELGFIENNRSLLRESKAVEDGIFDVGEVERLLAESTESNRDQAKLWLLISFELWYRKWRPDNPNDY